MDTFMYTVLPILGGLLLFALISVGVRASGMALQQKFVKLGNLQGKTYDEIVSACGLPKSQTSQVSTDGKPIQVRQWMATGYHIVLLFDENNICLGISHQASV